MLLNNMTALELKRKIAGFTSVDVDKIQLVKFFHRVIQDHVKVENIANTDGACFISAWSDQRSLSNHTVNLLFEDVGTCPLTEEDKAQQRDRRLRLLERQPYWSRPARTAQAGRPAQPGRSPVRHMPADYNELSDGSNDDDPWFFEERS